MRSGPRMFVIAEVGMNHCRLYIGQTSGPNWMGGTVGHASLLCDAVPYSGTFVPTDLVLHKPIYETDTGRRLSIVEVFRDHVDLVLGYHYGRKGIELGHNSSDEILKATKESVAALEGPVMLSEDDRRLCERFARVVPSQAIISYQGNRPPLFVLRQHEKQLMEEA